MRLSSARTIASARRRFVACSSKTFSLTVSRAMSRNANTGRVCPIRCARSIARVYGRVPPRVQQEHVFSGGEVQAETTRFQTDEKQRTTIALKSLDAGLAVPGLTVQVLVSQLRFVEPCPQQAE